MPHKMVVAEEKAAKGREVTGAVGQRQAIGAGVNELGSLEKC